jgi:hypothetical protein
MVAGRELTPKDVADTQRLMRYWAEGKGAAKIQWGVPGDFDRCRVELGKYVHDPGTLNGLCANLHKRATGGWPGHAPGIEESMAKAKEAKDKGS